jgi:hypothetical protein
MPPFSILSSPFAKGDRGIFYGCILKVIRNISMATAIDIERRVA